MGVGQDLDLDVARFGQISLHVALIASEVRKRFALRRSELISGLVGASDNFHAATASAERSLDRNRPSVRFAEGDDFGRVREDRSAAWHPVDVDLLGRFAGTDLVAHHFDCSRRRTDEGNAALRYGTSEVSVLGKEAVARVYGIGTRFLERAEDRVGVEIRLGCCLPAEGVGLVG